MRTDQLIKSFDAGAAVTKRRIVKIGAADNAVIQAAAATDIPVGVAAEVDVASGELCEVVVAGVADVECGGIIARGAKVTSDSVGKAVTSAAPSQNIGVALQTSADGDIIQILLTHSVTET